MALKARLDRAREGERLKERERKEERERDTKPKSLCVSKCKNSAKALKSISI